MAQSVACPDVARKVTGSNPVSHPNFSSDHPPRPPISPPTTHPGHQFHADANPTSTCRRSSADEERHLAKVKVVGSINPMAPCSIDDA